MFIEPKSSIEVAARDDKDIKKIAKNTIKHEIAHRFGIDEARVRQKKKKQQSILVV